MAAMVSCDIRIAVILYLSILVPLIPVAFLAVAINLGSSGSCPKERNLLENEQRSFGFLLSVGGVGPNDNV